VGAPDLGSLRRTRYGQAVTARFLPGLVEFCLRGRGHVEVALGPRHSLEWDWRGRVTAHFYPGSAGTEVDWESWWWAP
jgi:hypothetical protein